MFTGKKTGIVISGADTIEVRFGDEMEFDDLEQEEPRVLYENEIYEGDLEFSEELYEDNDEDKTEGVHYRNVFCSYFHGPLLVRNQHLADRMIELAAQRQLSKQQ